MISVFLHIFTPWDCVIMVMNPGCFILPCGTWFFGFIIMKTWVNVPEISLDPYIKWPKSMNFFIFLVFCQMLAAVLLCLGFYFALSPYFRNYDIMTNVVNLFGASFMPTAFTLLFITLFVIIFLALIDRMQDILMNNPQRGILTWAKNTLNLYKRFQGSLNTALLLLLSFQYI